MTVGFVSIAAAVAKWLPVALQLFKAGHLAYTDIQEILDRYKGKEPTDELKEQIRIELLRKARIASPLDDPEIRELLVADGVDPDSLRIKIGE